jgi:hypothetical protein
MKLITKYLIIFAFTLSALPAMTSQVHFIPLEEDIKNINFIIQVKVTNIEKESTYMKLENGQDGPMTSTSIIISGKVKNIVWGKCELKEIKTKYTWIVPVKYNEKGDKILSFSPIRSGSGIENKVEIGKEYLFSFAHIDEAKNIQYHMRMDEVNRKTEIVGLLKNTKSNF